MAFVAQRARLNSLIPGWDGLTDGERRARLVHFREQWAKTLEHRAKMETASQPFTPEQIAAAHKRASELVAECDATRQANVSAKTALLLALGIPRSTVDRTLTEFNEIDRVRKDRLAEIEALIKEQRAITGKVTHGAVGLVQVAR